jgi:hypothetical protein
MQTTQQTLWEQLSPEQQARIIAVLVEMLLRHLARPVEAAHDAS